MGLHDNQDPSLNFFLRYGVFADWKLPTDEEIRFVNEDLRFHDIVIGITNKPNTPNWQPKYSVDRVKERIEACSQVGLNPILMTWVVRNQYAINAMCDFILECTYPSQRPLLDTEESYYEGSLSPKKAAQLIAKRLVRRKWGVTSLGKCPSSVKPLAKYAYFYVPFAYSFWKPVNVHWSHSIYTFPGPQQDEAYNSWRDLNPEAEFIMGLGAYWGERPAQGYTPKLSIHHTMRFAAIETAALGVEAVYYWSLKWMIANTKAGKQVRSFFGIR